jgi:hypothetical protein
MFTGNQQPTVHTFKAVNKGKYKGTIHYDLISNDPFLQADKINISKDRKCANSSPAYWIRIREGNKWSNCITGLFPTSKQYVFKGDYNEKESLILFKFSDNAETLTIFFF